MKKRFFLFALIPTLLATIIFVSCRKGEKGDPGPAGTSTLPFKDGSITGTLSGTSNLMNEPFTHNLNFQYYANPAENAHTEVNYSGLYEYYTITRYDETGSSYIKFEFDIDYYDDNQDGTDDPHIYNPYVTIVYNNKSSASNVFYFGTTSYYSYSNPFDVSSVYLSTTTSGGVSNITIDNLSINNNTGQLSFDYDLELGSSENSTSNSAFMSGTVNITTYNVDYREGSSK